MVLITKPQLQLIQANKSLTVMRDRMIDREEKSLATFNRYIEGVKRFVEYMKAENPDAALKMFAAYPSKDLTDKQLRMGVQNRTLVLDGYIGYLKGERKNSAVNLKAQFFGVKKWLTCNQINGDSINYAYAVRPKVSVMLDDKIPTKQQLRTILTNKVSLRDKAFFMVALSSGLRIGTLGTLQVKDYKPYEELGLITVAGGEGRKLAKGKKYATFITPETRAVLEEYLRTRGSLDPKAFLFELPTRTNNITRQWRVLLKRSFLDQKVEGHNFTELHTHTLRKFFQTTLKYSHVGSGWVDRMMGHHPFGSNEYLDDAYFRPTLEQCAEEYRKAVPALTIFEDVDAVTQKHIMQKQEEEIEDLKAKLFRLEGKIAQMVASDYATSSEAKADDERAYEALSLSPADVHALKELLKKENQRIEELTKEKLDEAEP